MSTGVTITLIVCGTVLLVTVLVCVTGLAFWKDDFWKEE